MLAIVNQLSVKADWADKIEAAFLEHLELLQQESGFKGFRFLKALNPDESPCLVEVIWQDQASFEAWKQSEHFKLSHANMGKYREAFYGPPKFGRYSVSSDLHA